MNAAPLNRRQAEALIASRLASLGHAPAFLAPDAAEELIARSAGAQGLQAALSATLFLASTEDAPQIERVHVERAVPRQGETLLAADVDPRRRWLKPALSVGVGAGLVGLGLAAWMAGHVETKPQTRQLAPHVTPVLRQVTRQVVPPEQPKQLPAIGVPQDAPPAIVTLSIQYADHEAEARLAVLAERLSQLNIGKIDVQTKAAPKACLGVCYFFAEDAGLASTVTRRLEQATNGAVSGKFAAPVLVLQPEGGLARPPGTIEASVP